MELLAKLFSAYDGLNVILWSALPEEINEIKTNKENKKKLAGIKLDLNKIFVTNDVKSLNDVEMVIFAVASNFIRQVVKKVHLELKYKKHKNRKMRFLKNENCNNWGWKFWNCFSKTFFGL